MVLEIILEIYARNMNENRIVEAAMSVNTLAHFVYCFCLLNCFKIFEAIKINGSLFAQVNHLFHLYRHKTISYL